MRGGSAASGRRRAARPRAGRRPSRAARRPRARRRPPARSSSAFRAFSRRSTAIAAWCAKSPRSSISCRVNSVCSGRSRTDRTPSAPSSWRSGAAISPFGTYPVPSATSLANRGSLPTSSMTRGVRVASTQPAMPVPAGKRVPRSVSSPSPTTASNTSSSVSSSRSRIDDALAPKIERATSTIAERSARNDSSEPTTPAATAARRSGCSVTSHLRRSSRSGTGRSSAGRASARGASRG